VSDVAALLGAFSRAVCKGDGRALGALFAEDGVYHDGFYGEFKGREAIGDMLEKLFHRDGRDFFWRFEPPVASGDTAFARFRFGYVTRIPGHEGRKVAFDGISEFRLKDGLIARYSEMWDLGVAMTQIGFAPERIVKALQKRVASSRPD
jgi:ketosteroid isomerase-like protein